MATLEVNAGLIADYMQEELFPYDDPSIVSVQGNFDTSKPNIVVFSVAYQLPDRINQLRVVLEEVPQDQVEFTASDFA